MSWADFISPASVWWTACWALLSGAQVLWDSTGCQTGKPHLENSCFLEPRCALQGRWRKKCRSIMKHVPPPAKGDATEHMQKKIWTFTEKFVFLYPSSTHPTYVLEYITPETNPFISSSPVSTEQKSCSNNRGSGVYGNTSTHKTVLLWILIAQLNSSFKYIYINLYSTVASKIL